MTFLSIKFLEVKNKKFFFILFCILLKYFPSRFGYWFQGSNAGTKLEVISTPGTQLMEPKLSQTQISIAPVQKKILKQKQVKINNGDCGVRTTDMCMPSSSRTLLQPCAPGVGAGLSPGNSSMQQQQQVHFARFLNHFCNFSILYDQFWVLNIERNPILDLLFDPLRSYFCSYHILICNC